MKFDGYRVLDSELAKTFASSRATRRCSMTITQSSMALKSLRAENIILDREVVAQDKNENVSILRTRKQIPLDSMFENGRTIDSTHLLCVDLGAT